MFKTSERHCLIVVAAAAADIDELSGSSSATTVNIDELFDNILIDQQPEVIDEIENVCI